MRRFFGGLLVFAMLGLSCACAEEKKVDEKKVSEKREAKPRLKGVEMYSWQSKPGEWIFVLLDGTNDIKEQNRIKQSPNAVKGVAEIKKALAKLAVGENVFWNSPANGFEFPAKAIQDEIRMAAKAADVKLSR
jgi:hypothetical protein